MDLKSHMFRKKVHPLILKIEGNQFVGSNPTQESESKASLNGPLIEANKKQEVEVNEGDLKEVENGKLEGDDEKGKDE